MNNNLIIKNCSIGYNKKRQLVNVKENINLTISSGKLVGVIGKNGIGKSTLLKTISGIIKPLNGEILINEENINKLSAKELSKKVSLVLTENIENSYLSAYDIIALGRQPYTNYLGKLNENDANAINNAIALTQCKEFVFNKFDELSDGQKQIVMIARAIAQDTLIIILDEPTTHLDLVNKILILKLLKTLAHKTNKIILLSTHDIELSLQLIDKMLVITSDDIFYNSTQEIINKNILNKVFNDDNILFNPEIGTFIFT